jgi:hypothetical protein
MKLTEGAASSCAGLALMGANTLLGNDVYNKDGEDLGDITEFMIDMASGNVAYAVLSFGGLLGMVTSTALGGFIHVLLVVAVVLFLVRLSAAPASSVAPAATPQAAANPCPNPRYPGRINVAMHGPAAQSGPPAPAPARWQR